MDTQELNEDIIRQNEARDLELADLEEFFADLREGISGRKPF